MLQEVAMVHFSLWPDSPVCGYTTAYLFSHQLTDI